MTILCVSIVIEHRRVAVVVTMLRAPLFCIREFFSFSGSKLKCVFSALNDCERFFSIVTMDFFVELCRLKISCSYAYYAEILGFFFSCFF